MVKYKNARRPRSTKKSQKCSTKCISKMRSIANDAVKKKAEKKYILQGFQTLVAGNNSASTTVSPDAYIQALTPNNSSLQITQGTKQYQRIGNKITITSAKLNLAIWPRADTANNTQNLQNIRVMILYDKRNPTLSPTPFSNLDFFEQSSATGSFGFTGQAYDLINEINHSRYRILYDKTFKLGQATLISSGDPLYNYQANNDFKAFHKLTIPLTNKIVKNLIFNDDYTNAQWRGAYLFCYGVAASSAGNTANINVANLYGQVKINFIDV